MEKERRVKTLTVIALIIAVLGLTVAFASLSQNLKINGTAGMNPVNWDVHLDNIHCEKNTGIEWRGKSNCDGIVNNPIINNDGLSITNLDVVLTKPGDYGEFLVDIINGGEIDAKFTDIIINGISFAKLKELCSDESKQETCEKIYYQMFKSVFVEADLDGDGITTDEEKAMAIEQGISLDFGITPYFKKSYDPDNFNIGEILSFGEKLEARVGFIWSEDWSTELPKGEVKLKLDIKFVFTQA